MDNKSNQIIKLYFSDYFNISEDVVREYGAFNISLVADLPLFIDPFLLFNSDNATYKKLHAEIINYLRFLRDKSSGSIDRGLLNAWYRFPEVKENWFGYTRSGNSGHGLGPKFASALNLSLDSIFKNFGDEKITASSHLEKLCLVREGVGRDNISDFTTNLTKGFLLEYTQAFATKHLSKDQVREFAVQKSRFNYKTEVWESAKFVLPSFEGKYILLTPRDILTKDETWINKDDLLDEFADIPSAIPNEELRAQLNNYFLSQIPKGKKTKRGKERPPSKADLRKAAFRTIQEFPAAIDYYIKLKEDKGELAQSISLDRVVYSEEVFHNLAKELSERLATTTGFYASTENTYEEARKRVQYLKETIEKNDMYRVFYGANGAPIRRREDDIQVMFRLVWYASPSSVDREVNNGRGPVDYKISRGSPDSSLVEFKLAGNKSLKKNLQKQVEVYKEANKNSRSITVILYFSEAELFRVRKILKELSLAEGDSLVLIDARNDNKPSGSKA